ncbi:DUF3718 domain-containing protein [Bowmanella sp. Y26]|uniref:DUF3718 domain-containing protein n=1 Tax=Bowmanella yangjiangensis TaxID=2811230 RepID=A0ABS3CWG3_9ALTE|nr:DUF3718 domain-containing protein [Bowmanella yangjiangensis]MBN7820844.1 DUF3718 domain-containing protein [Bowmanella yangjiangensis]MBT1064073.1 DUF3718 domain-containing protein [Bowmanella yangjiangensis]
MYKRTLVTAILAAAFSVPSLADINADLQNICTIVKNNDKSELRKKMKKVRDDYNLKLGDVYEGISCEGLSLIRYAMLNSADDAGEYMVKSMSRSDLQKTEKDGSTVEQWAEANGHLKSATGLALVDRLNAN